MSQLRNALSVDVEDWFQVQAFAGIIPRDSWDTCERRVERNTHRVLDLYIDGADDYGSGKATDISGITTDDSTGAITIKLSQAYGAFDNILAFMSAAPIPSSTPMTVLSNTPPVGVGPYKFGTIVPNQSYTLVRNASFAGFKIPVRIELRREPLPRNANGKIMKRELRLTG